MRKSLFVLRNSLLAHILTYDSRQEYRERLDRGWPHCKGGPAYALFVALIRHNFGIQRWPGHEDRNLCVGQCNDLTMTRELFLNISYEDFKSAANELLELYMHTQSVLKETYGNDPVPLVRGIRYQATGDQIITGYAGAIVAAWRSAKANGENTVTIEMDTANSWSSGKQPYSGYAGVTLRLQVPQADIVFNSNTLDNIEGGEWIVINRHPCGLVKFTIEDIEVERWLENANPEIQSHKSQDQRFPYVPQPLYSHVNIPKSPHSVFSRLINRYRQRF